jgi:hypothetical protein
LKSEKENNYSNYKRISDFIFRGIDIFGLDVLNSYLWKGIMNDLITLIPKTDKDILDISDSYFKSWESVKPDDFFLRNINLLFEDYSPSDYSKKSFDNSLGRLVGGDIFISTERVADNANDFKESMVGLNKVQASLEVAYLELGVKQEVLNDLMERNGGHGEWLTFAEAKEYGFVGKEWKNDKISNYAKQEFSNRKILIPNNLINQTIEKKSTMEIGEKEKKGIIQEVVNFFKNEKAEEIKNAESDDMKAENEELKAKIVELEAEIETLKAGSEEEVEEDVVEEVVNTVEETKTVETLEAELTATKTELKEALKASAKPISKTKTTNSKQDKDLPFWKSQFNIHNKIK